MEVDMKESFDLFDSNSDGYINLEEFTILLRVLGIAVEISEIKTIYEKNAKPEGLTFEDFLLCHADLKPKCITKELMIAAVNMLDKQKTGFSPSSELKRILTSVGDGMSSQEISDLFSLIRIDEKGVVKVEDFINHLSSIYD